MDKENRTRSKGNNVFFFYIIMCKIKWGGLFTSTLLWSLSRLTYRGSAGHVNYWSWATMSEAACSWWWQQCWMGEKAPVICLICLFSQVWIFHGKICWERNESFICLCWWDVTQVRDYSFIQANIHCFPFPGFLICSSHTMRNKNIQTCLIIFLNRLLSHLTSFTKKTLNHLTLFLHFQAFPVKSIFMLLFILTLDHKSFISRIQNNFWECFSLLISDPSGNTKCSCFALLACCHSQGCVCT